MYIPDHFALSTAEAERLLSPVAAGDLVTRGERGLQATFVPMLFTQAGEHGTLIGHVSKVNSQWRDEGEALFILNGPQDYVDANWLSRPDAPSVPTWNYIAVHAHGELIAHPDPEWTLDAVRRLSAGRDDHAVDDLPEEAVEKLLRSIVGVELRITKLVGKAKMSQNKSPEVIAQVIEGLAESGNADAAEWMREHSLPRAEAKLNMLSEIREQTSTNR